MLEKQCIQSRGFRNIKENGEVIGFQVKVRSSYFPPVVETLLSGPTHQRRLLLV